MQGGRGIDRFHQLWNVVYPGETEWREETAGLIAEIAGDVGEAAGRTEEDWFSRAVIYSLYVDLFNNTIEGLTEKLPYLENLGITCLHLLPVLDSPMKDAGFDISDYAHIRSGLAASGNPDAEFDRLIAEAHRRGIRIIFDIALNHCSSEHPWFEDARSSRDARCRDFFIWSDTSEKYSSARIIFKGLCDSNWEYDEAAGQYYFHRFFPIQSDLNYRNPEVLYEMIAVLLSWLRRGIDGFRADAIPYLWKEEGTNCENLPGTHNLLKIFRYALEAVKPGTLFLAEANQVPRDVVEYLRTEDECNAGYHFPLMPQIYKALATGSGESVRRVLSPAVTPDIPASASWVTFLRCHDELTLEMVTPEDRRLLFDHYARRPEWNFREGEGIAGRLFTLLDGDTDRIILAFTLIFTLPGTPVIYYGDEVALPNDTAYWEEQRRITGYDDSRYLNRGPVPWRRVEENLADPASAASKVRGALKRLITLKKTEDTLASGRLEFRESEPGVLAYDRIGDGGRVSVWCNLGATERTVPAAGRELFASAVVEQDGRRLKASGVVITAEGEKT